MIDGTLYALIEAYFTVAEACNQNRCAIVSVSGPDGVCEQMNVLEALLFYEKYFSSLRGSIIAKAFDPSIQH